MTTTVDIVNLALQSFGSRTTLTAAQLTAGSNNEAKQSNLTFGNDRDTLLRMAPWDCGIKTANLQYISSVPGTPENTSAATSLWQPGQPPPPWAYEYQYPNDCLRACWMIPAVQTGFSGGVPITTAVTGGASTMWLGGPVRYKIQTDMFFAANAMAITTPGTGYVINEIITLALGPTTSAPIGGPAQVQVDTVDGSGGILTAHLISQVIDTAQASVIAGSYFTRQAGAQAQGSTTGVGTGATFTLTFASTQTPQRVILTNQEFATLAYVAQITNPNIWDPLFQDAMANKHGASIVMALTGDKQLANMCIANANLSILEARKVDGNEGLTINDVTPDWIRTRGLWWTDTEQSGPYVGFDWGGLLPSYF